MDRAKMGRTTEEVEYEHQQGNLLFKPDMAKTMDKLHNREAEKA